MSFLWNGLTGYYNNTGMVKNILVSSEMSVVLDKPEDSVAVNYPFDTGNYILSFTYGASAQIVMVSVGRDKSGDLKYSLGRMCVVFDSNRVNLFCKDGKIVLTSNEATVVKLSILKL